MKLREKFNRLRDAAIKDVRAVRNRRTVHSGDYPKGCSSLVGAELIEGVKEAAKLGYETHLRYSNGVLGVYYVANMPPAPTDVLYA